MSESNQQDDTGNHAGKSHSVETPTGAGDSASIEVDVTAPNQASPEQVWPLIPTKFELPPPHLEDTVKEGLCA